jgi:general stress protein 26
MKPTELETFRDLLRDFDTAVLMTYDRQKRFRARPMAIAHVEDNCDLWFITNEDSAKVHEIEANTRVHVTCQNGRSSCLSISGHASLSRDRLKIREIWKPPFRIWFPEGEEDPNIVLIHVKGEQGEYWDSTWTEGLLYAYQAIKAVVTGTTPKIVEGEQHGKVRLAHW